MTSLFQEGDAGILCASDKFLLWLALPVDGGPSFEPWTTLSASEEQRYQHGLLALDEETIYLFGGENGKWQRVEQTQSPPGVVNEPGKAMAKARSKMAVGKMPGYYFPQCLKLLYKW